MGKLWNRLITSAHTIEDANLYGHLKRSHLAKMISIFAIKLLWRTPDRTRDCSYSDIGNQSYDLQYYMQASCQLWLMWLQYDWSPDVVFNPNEEVTRAEFGTVFSRLLYGWRYNGNKDCWYCRHLAQLKKDGIMTQTENPEQMIELRWYVMLMMKRAFSLWLSTN